MTELERIERYISKTIQNSTDRYDMKFSECIELAKQDSLDAVHLAFRYGKAKGYRAAKAEMKAKQKVEVR